MKGEIMLREVTEKEKYETGGKICNICKKYPKRMVAALGGLAALICLCCNIKESVAGDCLTYEQGISAPVNIREDLSEMATATSSAIAVLVLSQPRIELDPKKET